ncbi:MAG: hypothetical protein OJI74_06845, partial [Rhodanobacter thiooxydans]|nr:hypothetical protein [Rhodanobacter thiooxydans]
QAFNYRHVRNGTLWQGRFKSCLVDTERYLLTVMRYIELNPRASGHDRQSAGLSLVKRPHAPRTRL